MVPLRVAGLLAESRQGQNKEGRDAGPEVRAQGPERRRPDEGEGPLTVGKAAARPRRAMRPLCDRAKTGSAGAVRASIGGRCFQNRHSAVGRALAFGSVRRGAPRGVVGLGARPVALDPGGADEVGCLICVSTSRAASVGVRDPQYVGTLVCLA